MVVLPAIGLSVGLYARFITVLAKAFEETDMFVIPPPGDVCALAGTLLGA